MSVTKAKGFSNKELEAAKKQEEFSVNKKLDSVRYELAAEANGYDWPRFRQNTIEKLIKGIENPNGQDFKLFDDWLRVVHKGPLEPILTDRVL